MTGRRTFAIDPWRIVLEERPGVPRVVTWSVLAQTAARALGAVPAPAPATVGLILADDPWLAELNAKAMGHEGATDVLSFPLLPPEAFPSHPGKAPAASARTPTFVLPPDETVHLGEIVVSVERAIEQARAGRGGQTGRVTWSPADEMRLLVTHGVLHLCGWDHADPAEGDAMRALEQQLLTSDRHAEPTTAV